MQVPLGPSRFPTLVWHRAALVGLALLKFLTPPPPPPPPPPRAGTDRDRPSLRASLLRPKLGTPRNLSSLRAPSIRRALPVLLGGLLCAVGSTAIAQTIVEDGVSFVSKPTGGPNPNSPNVYIIGDTVQVAVNYSSALSGVGTPTLGISLGAANRVATCGIATGDNRRLLCSYVIEEGDQVLSEPGIAVRTGTLQGGNLPSRAFDAPDPHEMEVDGVRLKIATIETGVGDAPGFKANDEIQLDLTFRDDDEEVVTTGGFGATLVFDNAERATRFVRKASSRVLEFTYKVVDGDNARALGLKLSGADALKDKNGNIGLAKESGLGAALAAMSAAERRVDTTGPRVTQILASASAETEFVNSGTVTFDVFFDEKVAAQGATLRVAVGTRVVNAECDDIAVGTPAEKLTCEWEDVQDDSGYLDSDGIATLANPLVYDFITDELDNRANPAFPATPFKEIKVDTEPPTVAGATISVPRVEINSDVIVKVTFSENVQVSGAGQPSAVIAIDGNPKDPAAFWSVAGKVVEFRYALKESGDLVRRTQGNTSSTVEVRSLDATGIQDLAGNDADGGGITGTRAADPGTTFSRKTVPTDGSEAEVYADVTVPRLERISLTGNVKKVYGIGDPITFEILFSESVTVKGARLAYKIGNVEPSPLPTIPENTGRRFTVTHNVLAANKPGSVTVSGIVLPTDGDSILDGSTFTVTRDYKDVQGGDVECNPSCTFEGRGWISDADGNSDSIPGRTEVPRSTNKISKSLTGSATVDTTLPKIKSVELLATPAPGAVGNDGQRYYGRSGGKGEVVHIAVTMDEDVTVTGDDPTLAMTGIAGGDQAVARYAKERSGKRRLIFVYTVEVGHTSRTGIGVSSLTNHESIKDVGGNSCSENCEFGTWSATQSGRHLVDGSLTGDQKVPALTDPDAPAQTAAVRTTTVVRSTTPTGGYYKTGDTITIEVSLSPAVTFTSAPQLLVNFDEGGSQRLTPAERISSSGTPTTRLTYSYRVASGDEDLDGFTGSLSGGGTATVEDGRRATLGSVSVGGIRIDALAPELDSLRITSSAGSDGTYTVGDDIVVSATFSEDVERQGTTDPSVPIQVGDATRTATLQSPNATSGGDTWVFSYKVVAGDNDTDGVSIAANALKGALEDAAGNDADIAHSAVSASTSHKVDTQGPSVTAVEVTGSGDDNLFLEGDTITATVTFDEEVDVVTRGSGAVRVLFNIGTEQRPATYAGGDGTETLTFTYDVEAGDTGQISLPADALEGEVEDAAGNEAEGTLALSGGPYTVDASAPMLVEAPSITSSPPNGGDTYAEGDLITLQVSFDEPVMVTGEPRLPIQVGPRPRNIVLYTSGSGTDTLTFSYTVRNGDTDDDGVSVDANALRLPAGAAIADVNGLTAAIEHGALADQPGHKVDAIAPGIESVAITSTPASDDAYLIDEMIEVTVTFSEDIATDGTPTLDLMVGEGVRAAACAQGSAGTQLTCSYTVVANDFDADGISVDADMLKGTITDMVGNPATLTHEALEDDPAHKVYAAAPEAVRTIDRLSLAAGGGTNSLDLTGIFTGFQLSYAAVSSNTNVATATVSGTDLTVVSGMEGTARVTVTASNLAGEASVSFDVLVATDPAETAVLNDALAAIGRSMLSSTASVIGSRFELASTGSQMALGGSRFGGSLSPQMQRFLAGNDPFALEERMSERALFSGSGSQQAYGGGYGLTADRLLTGTSFNMPLNAMGTGDAQFAVWGAGDLQSFEGEPDDGMYDGSSSSGYIGVDARGDGWLAGVSVSRSGAEADYDFDGLVEGRNTGGTLETSVTAFHPYARLEVGADSEVWVIGGFGGGEADLSRTHVSGSQSSDLSMAMAVGGLRRALAMEFGGADLSLRGDAGFLSLETDSGMMAVDGLSASVSRLRLGLEAAWEGESATPFVEVSGRFDGGDGQTGGGLELAGGLRILNPESGFGLEAKGRILAMHTGDGYSESGIGVTASFEPGAAGRGITFRLSPRWGGSADSTDLFWDEVGNVRDASQYAYGLDRAQTWGVDAALGYGFGLRSMPGVVTPFGQMDVTGDQDQRIRVGVRYGLMQGLLGGTQVELSAERVDGEMHRVGETRVLVSGRARF